jgi:hypothetical protein
MGNAKTFAVMGLIFSAVECVVEKVDAVWRFFQLCAVFKNLYLFGYFELSWCGRLGQGMTLPIQQ